MKAMILAAGHGTRMRPLTDHTPKPLLPAGGKPLIVWHIEKLARAGFRDIVINLAWLGWKIPEALGDGSRWNVNLHYSDEQQEGALETAGGIIKALPLLGNEPFLVVNGDVWCDYPCKPFQLAEHDLAHLVLVANPLHHPQGDFGLNQGRVSSNAEVIAHIPMKNLTPTPLLDRRGAKKRHSFSPSPVKERGAGGEVLLEECEQLRSEPRYTFSGIGYYRPELFAGLPQGKHPLAPLLRRAMQSHQVSGEYFAGDWRDIGTPERLAELDQDLSSNAVSNLHQGE